MQNIFRNGGQTTIVCFSVVSGEEYYRRPFLSPHQMQKCFYGERLNTFLQREGVVACMDNIPFGRLQIFTGPVEAFGD